jgi:hypothetical protein
MTPRQIVSARFKNWKPFTDEEIATVLARGDERQVFDAMLLCRNVEQEPKLRARWLELTKSMPTK